MVLVRCSQTHGLRSTVWGGGLYVAPCMHARNTIIHMAWKDFVTSRTPSHLIPSQMTFLMKKHESSSCDQQRKIIWQLWQWVLVSNPLPLQSAVGVGVGVGDLCGHDPSASRSCPPVWCFARPLRTRCVHIWLEESWIHGVRYLDLGGVGVGNCKLFSRSRSGTEPEGEIFLLFTALSTQAKIESVLFGNVIQEVYGYSLRLSQSIMSDWSQGWMSTWIHFLITNFPFHFLITNFPL